VRAKRALSDAFRQVEQIERKAFGDNSYFQRKDVGEDVDKLLWSREEDKGDVAVVQQTGMSFAEQPEYEQVVEDDNS